MPTCVNLEALENCPTMNFQMFSSGKINFDTTETGTSKIWVTNAQPPTPTPAPPLPRGRNKNYGDALPKKERGTAAGKQKIRARAQGHGPRDAAQRAAELAAQKDYYFASTGSK